MAFPAWVLAVSLIPVLAANAGSESQAAALFVFGDSLVDPGNNNRLPALAKANYYPNGIDFPAGTTGRFCNGATVADYLVNLLDLPYTTRYADLWEKGSKMSPGVNYASAGAGILNDTLRVFGNIYPMDQQIENYERSLVQLRLELASLKGGEVGDFLAKSLFFISVGSNDYINDYLLPSSTTRLKYTISEFHELVIGHFREQLKRLYDLGGRKFLIAGVGPLGCTPFEIASSRNLSECVESKNEIALQHNAKLRTMIGELNANLPASYFLYWDTYSSFLDIVQHPDHYGFKYSHKACCGLGRAKGQTLCPPLLPTQCHNRSQFAFWDAYHPTDAVNAILAKQAYQGKLQATYPTNVRDLVQL